MIEKTVAELSGSLSRGDISSVELTQAYLDRINRTTAPECLCYGLRGIGSHPGSAGGCSEG